MNQDLYDNSLLKSDFFQLIEFCLDLINILILDYPDCRLSRTLNTPAPPSLDNRGSTVTRYTRKSGKILEHVIELAPVLQWWMLLNNYPRYRFIH